MTNRRIFFIFVFVLQTFAAISAVQLHNKLYQEISAKDAHRNIIYSPFSIQLCVALAHLGAKGQTQEEIAHVLGYTPDFDSKNLSTVLQTFYKENNALQVANKVYVKSGHTLNPKYKHDVTGDLKSEVESIDFDQKAIAAANINEWIENQTNHKIKNMISSEMISHDTLMMLVNAVYFKGAWEDEFRPSLEGEFTNSDGNVVKTQIMQNTEDYEVGHIESLSAHIVKLKYHETNIAMYVIIPDETQGLGKIEQNLEKLNFKELKSQLQMKYIEFFLPKFEFDLNVSLTEILQKMGMVTAFMDNADFSGMFEAPVPMKVSNAIHKAFIKVDEKGTEAAGVTGKKFLC